MECKKCEQEKGEEFYPKDTTCKDCRKKRVKENRAANSEHYKEYDRNRFQNDPRVKARHKKYQSSPEGLAAGSRAKRAWTERNEIKRGASTIVGNAVRDGKLIKPEACDACKSKPKRIHGHHDDYAYPLVVRWLCPGCHSQWHKKNGEGKNGGMT